jgi:hypothetical protein
VVARKKGRWWGSITFVFPLATSIFKDQIVIFSLGLLEPTAVGQMLDHLSGQVVDDFMESRIAGGVGKIYITRSRNTSGGAFGEVSCFRLCQGRRCFLVKAPERADRRGEWWSEHHEVQLPVARVVICYSSFPVIVVSGDRTTWL